MSDFSNHWILLLQSPSLHSEHPVANDWFANKAICRIGFGRYLDGRTQGKTRSQAGGAHPMVCVGPTTTTSE